MNSATAEAIGVGIARNHEALTKFWTTLRVEGGDVQGFTGGKAERIPADKSVKTEDKPTKTKEKK